MRRNTVAVLGCVLLAAWTAGAGTYRRLTLDALVQGSTYIVYGRVTESRAFWDSGTRMIWTRTEIQVFDSTKGQPGTAIPITEPGGVLNGSGELYPGTPQFRTNQELVIFVYRAPGNRLRVTGSLQGLYSVNIDPESGERLVAPAAPRPEIVYEEGSPYSQNIKQQLRGPERLSRFLYTIREKAASR